VPHRQRRAARREPLHAEVEMIEPRIGSGVTINASEGGLRVAVDCRLTEGDRCLLKVCDGERPRLERGRVVWVRELPDGFIAGLALAPIH